MQRCPQRHSLPAVPGQAVKELQTSTREAIVLLKAMIEEVRNSASEEEAAINSLFGRMQVRGNCRRVVPCAHGCPMHGHGRARAAGGDWGSYGAQGGRVVCRNSSPRGRRRS